MTITVGGGPLSRRPKGQGNFMLDAPEHRLLLEDYAPRLRAVVNGAVVLDSGRAAILHETGRQVVPYVPLDDFDASVLRPSATTTHCRHKGDASYWSLEVGGGRIEDAVWAYEDPVPSARWLAGLAALRWDVADAWYVENEIAFGPHLRDPYHRVDVYETARTATVRAGGRVIARTERAKLLVETSLPVRVYVPRADVDPGVLRASDTRTQCPYKGEARYFSLDVDGTRVEDAAFSYETPLPEALQVTGDVCFAADAVEVELAPRA